MTRTTRTARPRSHRRLAVAATAAPRVAPRGLLCQGSGGSLAPYSRREGRWPLRPRAVYCFSEGRDCGRSLPMSGWEQGGRWRRDEEERASRSQEDTMVIYLDLFFCHGFCVFGAFAYGPGHFFPPSRPGTLILDESSQVFFCFGGRDETMGGGSKGSGLAKRCIG